MYENISDIRIQRPGPEEKREEPAPVEKHPVEAACDSLLWGYVLLFIHIDIGTLRLLPPLVGYALLMDGARKLAKERESLSLLEPIAKALMITSSVEWVLSLFSLPNPLQSLWWITGLLDLYFHYQLVTDLCAIVSESGKEKLKKPVAALRTIRTLILLLGTFRLLLGLPEVQVLLGNRDVTVYLLVPYLFLILNLWANLAEVGVAFQKNEEEPAAAEQAGIDNSPDSRYNNTVEMNEL